VGSMLHSEGQAAELPDNDALALRRISMCQGHFGAYDLR
jgi:hypothetical protein